MSDWGFTSKQAPRADARIVRRGLHNPGEVAEIETLPPHDLVPGRTIYEALAHVTAIHPDKAAIVQLMQLDEAAPFSLDYRTYLAQVERAANLFRAASGEAGGERAVVAVVAPFIWEALVAMWGGATAGVYVPINPFLDFEHVAGIMNAAQATVLVIATARHGRGVWDQTDALKASVPSLRRTFLIGSGDGDDFLEALKTSRAGGLDFTPGTSAADDCAYMHTGGTTSVPKLVRHVHGSQLLQGWMCGMAMEPDEDTVIGHALPNFHVGGAVAVGVRSMIFGQTILTLTPSGFRNPDLVPNFWDVVERYGMTDITSAPTTAAAIMATGKPGPRTLRHYTCGGGPLSPELSRNFTRAYGLPLRDVWGGTEFHGILSFHYAGATPPRPASVGVDIPYHRVKSAILDGLRFVRWAKKGERGILIATGPTTTPGFVNPDVGKSFFIDGGPDGKQWATTGDVGAVDDDGYIFIYGREKDVIIRGGHNIDSAAIDEVLVTHPAVLFAAAVGLPDASKGELPMAYVQLRPGASVEASELLAFARENIKERAAIPVEIVLLEAIPMTAVGKVNKPPLRKEAVLRVAETTCAAVTGGKPVALSLEETAGRLTLVLQLEEHHAPFAEPLLRAFSPFAFGLRIDSKKNLEPS